ncbi:leucine--tRNA ligase [Panacibacter ginsenosidivorans]|uniref:Leucine--tRNA ligase n=1 Tax=Panacibacter ginsenosidivorans TaxID=1813871 RepID=A0A5B8VF91_9BACT|nr:class I tRNA ligase family protein [Panacibacter ginsenosidivorans]QEC70257.1 leucine--tRNA ligase [Panacibacter ginsenosidivorans]
MEYNFGSIEKKWQSKWKNDGAYKVPNDSSKPKYYVLDMFPYPSGAGLHVGHPLGYIASDIFARFKRLKGYNVLHPMGYDAFGLPAEQYAIEHGVHPADSTKQNIENFRSQLDKIGFSFDWDREVKTSDPSYYKWTQWIFLQLFKSFYNRKNNKAESIDVLIAAFEKEGNKNHPVPNSNYQVPNQKGNQFSAEQWKGFDEFTQQGILMEYRLAYCGYGEVNWCEALGTVLANDEVVNGVSERGGYPVVKKKLRQWYLRITEYADRLLEGLERVEFSEAMKEMQSNWIGKSYGAEIEFSVHDSAEKLTVYTTRPDTIFGVDFMVVAPEHEIIEKITTAKYKQDVEDYIAYVKNRSERERMAEKAISGCFTGAYAINPLNYREIPIYISEYVLAGYGTGAIMAVPCGDDRDFRFAKHFGINITNILGDKFNGEEANSTYDAELVESDFLTGMLMRDAAEVVITDLEGWGKGKRKVNYKMRDAAFSRQRYWGEPFPIKWEKGVAIPLDESELPLELPHVESYKPGPEGEGPLANIPEWTAQHLETNTMPGYAGSSWYFLRYMDPHNDGVFCDRKVSDYWGQVDLYIGGTEHAVGHLLYSRMWTKVLFDLGLIGHDEPYKKLVNQGMIQGKSFFADYIFALSVHDKTRRVFTSSYNTAKDYKQKFNNEGIDYEIVEAQTGTNRIQYAHKYIDSKNRITEDEYKKLVDSEMKFGKQVGEALINAVIWEKDLTEEGKRYFYCQLEIEKMSKSKFNVENPDDLVKQYGADTFRMYEMFLGPVEQSKPWDTKGIEGVHRFLRKLWRLFYDEMKGKVWNTDKATDAELKVLHKTIKKIEDDTERFSFNTAVSAFMVCVNDLHDLKCYKKEVLESLLILLTPYAPHVCEELWSQLGKTTSILDASYPKFEGKYLVESSKEYPVSVNGKLRTTLNLALDLEQKEVEQMVLQNEVIKKWLDGNQPRKIIYVKNKMINVVI